MGFRRGDAGDRRLSPRRPWALEEDAESRVLLWRASGEKRRRTTLDDRRRPSKAGVEAHRRSPVADHYLVGVDRHPDGAPTLQE